MESVVPTQSSALGRRSAVRRLSGANSTLAFAIAAAAISAVAVAAAPIAPAEPAGLPIAAEAESTVLVTFKVVHFRTGAPIGGWIVEALYLGPFDPVWSGRTGNTGSVTFDLIEGPYEVRVYRDHPVWISYIEVEVVSDDDQGLSFTIAVNPELN
jgi:hypothetical protein